MTEEEEEAVGEGGGGRGRRRREAEEGGGESHLHTPSQEVYSRSISFEYERPRVAKLCGRSKLLKENMWRWLAEKGTGGLSTFVAAPQCNRLVHALAIILTEVGHVSATPRSLHD